MVPPEVPLATYGPCLAHAAPAQAMGARAALGVDVAPRFPLHEIPKGEAVEGTAPKR